MMSSNSKKVLSWVGIFLAAAIIFYLQQSEVVPEAAFKYWGYLVVAIVVIFILVSVSKKLHQFPAVIPLQLLPSLILSIPIVWYGQCGLGGYAVPLGYGLAVIATFILNYNFIKKYLAITSWKKALYWTVWQLAIIPLVYGAVLHSRWFWDPNFFNKCVTF